MRGVCGGREGLQKRISSICLPAGRALSPAAICLARTPRPHGFPALHPLWLTRNRGSVHRSPSRSGFPASIFSAQGRVFKPGCLDLSLVVHFSKTLLRLSCGRCRPSWRYCEWGFAKRVQPRSFPRPLLWVRTLPPNPYGGKLSVLTAIFSYFLTTGSLYGTLRGVRR